MKEKRSTSEEPKNFLKQNLVAEISTKNNKHWTIFKIDKEQTETNGLKNKKIDDNAQGLTAKKQTLCVKKRRKLKTYQH